MCGICGFAGAGGPEDLRAMNAELVHRGPDGEGCFADEAARVFLGHRRLAIIDIEGGAQPMWNEDETVGVVFNGEIYNHLDLRRELEGRRHRFRTDHSDTEALVHGYEEWGEDLPLRLNGMFAFAVYDRRGGRLFLARDRFGKKPLYCYCGNGLFAFASELRALSRHSGFDPTVDKRSVQKFFAYGFLPAPNALYRNAFKLPGGCRLRLDVRSGRWETDRYWRFRIEPAEKDPPGGEGERCEELRHLLSRAVERRLMSDVPLGVFLSGGIDSSAVLRFAGEHLPPSEIESFSIGFREPSFDESGYAREAAAWVGSSHHEELLSIEGAKGLLSEVLDRVDEPIGDPSLLPTYLLSSFARRRVTVALGGDGGDELFAGYDPFRALGPARLYARWIPGGFHRGLRRLADLLPLSPRNMSLDFRIRRSLAGLSYPERLWNPVWLGALEPGDITDLFHEPCDPEELYSEAIAAWEESGGNDIVDKTLEFYTLFYLQDEILMKVDRASMMVSLEVRAPFLDNDVVEFARRLPHRFKFRNGSGKYLLRKALKGLLPERILHRKKKGFGIPLAAWLRELPYRPGGRAIPYLDAAEVERRWRAHARKEADHRLFLWCWLALDHHMNPAPPRAAAT